MGRTPLKRSLRPGYRRPTLSQLTTTLTQGVPRLNTAFQALFGSRALKLVQTFDSAPRGETWIFIYGGSTSVGLYAIQLAKISGYKIVTVASPRNHELLKNYGADVVFDVGT
jgi:NADPH:quinone reductase-like Zn-dependent oxidoreductase